MARIARRATIGVRVVKGPIARRIPPNFFTNTEKLKASQNIEPQVIDRNSHKKFVDNIFSIRRKSYAS
jgi:hypothetical protein